MEKIAEIKKDWFCINGSEAVIQQLINADASKSLPFNVYDLSSCVADLRNNEEPDIRSLCTHLIGMGGWGSGENIDLKKKRCVLLYNGTDREPSKNIYVKFLCCVFRPYTLPDWEFFAIQNRNPSINSIEEYSLQWAIKFLKDYHLDLFFPEIFGINLEDDCLGLYPDRGIELIPIIFDNGISLPEYVEEIRKRGLISDLNSNEETSAILDNPQKKDLDIPENKKPWENLPDEAMKKFLLQCIKEGKLNVVGDTLRITRNFSTSDFYNFHDLNGRMVMDFISLSFLKTKKGRPMDKKNWDAMKRDPKRG